MKKKLIFVSLEVSKFFVVIVRVRRVISVTRFVLNLGRLINGEVVVVEKSLMHPQHFALYQAEFHMA